MRRQTLRYSALVMASGLFIPVANAGICEDNHKADLAACQTMPTIPRIVCVVVANETLADCLDTAAAAAARDTIIERIPAGSWPIPGPGSMDTIDIEIVALELTSVDHIGVEIFPGNGGPKFPLPTIPIPDGFSFDLDGDFLAPYFDDGYIVSILMYDIGDELVGGGAFVVPVPGTAALFGMAGLFAARRRR